MSLIGPTGESSGDGERGQPRPTARSDRGSQKSAPRKRGLARAGRKGVLFLMCLAAPSYAADVDAGSAIPPAVYAEQSQLLIPGGNWEEHGEGCFLPTARCVSTGKELERLRAENAELKRARPVSWTDLLLFGLGFFGGAAALGYLWWSFGR